MLELTRSVRFSLGADGRLATDAPRANTFSAWPPMRGLGRFYELQVHCRGRADPVTGFFMPIQKIDAAARARALPVIEAAVLRQEQDVGGVLEETLAALGGDLGDSLHAVTLRLSPTYSLCMERKSMSQVLLSQQYEFAAAHRLHAVPLSDEENRQVFGKCNHPAGHGHNYRVEVVVGCPRQAEGAVSSEKIDAIVQSRVIDRVDHRNLSVDLPELQQVNTTVENLAPLFYEWLKNPLREAGCRLDRVTVWETGKTSCTYAGGEA